MGRANGEKPSKPKKKVGRPRKVAPVDIEQNKANGVDQKALPNDGFSKVKLPEQWTPFTELSDKHKFFAKRYVLSGGVCTRAARDAGFDEWYASVRLLREPLIIKEIERFRAVRAKRFEVNADRVLAELTKVAFASLGDFIRVAADGTPIINCEEVGDEELAALAEITQDVYSERVPSADGQGDYESIPIKKTKIKLHPKVQALEMLGRIFKLFDGDQEKGSPEEKAAKIREALAAMKVKDGV